MTKIGFIGAGQMAQALASGFVGAEKVAEADVFYSDPSLAAIDAFRQRIPGAQLCSAPQELVESTDVIFLAVKPQHLDSVFSRIEERWDVLFVSIAAGVPLERLYYGCKSSRVIRVMPNTPCLVNAGAIAYCLGDAITKDDIAVVDELLNAVGVAHEVPESLMDAVTGLSGSGPAYVYQIIEAMSDGGVQMGLPREIATTLAAQTVLGAARMVLETGDHPGALKDRVTSPGGTTIAGVHAMESGRLRATMMNAVRAATLRSKELGASN